MRNMIVDPLEKPGPVDVDSTQLPPGMLDEMRAYVRDNPEPAATDDPDARMKYTLAASALEDERKRREAEEAAKFATPEIPEVLYGLWHPGHGFDGNIDDLDILAYRSNADAEIEADDRSGMWRVVQIGVHPDWRGRALAAESGLSDLKAAAKLAIHELIRRPMGVVPDSATECLKLIGE